jgi:uncharacterized protein
VPDLTSSPPRPWLRPELLRSWTEYLVAAALMMVLPIRSSTSAALRGSSGHFTQLLLTNTNMLRSIFWEVLLLVVFLLYLKWRGWTPADLRIGIGWWTSLQGVALLFLAYLGAIATLYTLTFATYLLESQNRSFTSVLASVSPHIAPGSIHFNWALVIFWMILNAFLEELICMGYIFNQLAARHGPLAALLFTVFLRAACHTYQDPIHLGGIVVLFIVFAAGYWYVRKLWPLIFAHILLDLGSVILLKSWTG